ncbi:hypothetical protein HPP92_012202 [Vanilla planifolia]|uniref:Uncharacterized protein n=1 Tax=Vanilla planifolia TaxID=51239 RepID=A0A835UZ64_VANPL|nr:hypothetical protein HPP92_012202 [Vanilla planifolia]
MATATATATHGDGDRNGNVRQDSSGCAGGKSKVNGKDIVEGNDMSAFEQHTDGKSGGTTIGLPPSNALDNMIYESDSDLADASESESFSFRGMKSLQNNYSPFIALRDGNGMNLGWIAPLRDA